MTTPPASPVILLVEDDDQVRSLVRILLTSDGYRVLEAGTGPEALRLARDHEKEIDLLLSDMLLPEISGYDVASAVKARNPDIKVILMTGWVEGEIVEKCISELGAAFLDKPFQPAKLRELVRDMLSSATRAG